VTPTLSTGNERLNTINTTINDRWAVANQNMADQISKLEEIRQVLITISGGEPSDIADELLGIAETVGNVAMILGAL
jgi:organic radical activating enzyme